MQPKKNSIIGFLVCRFRQTAKIDLFDIYYIPMNAQKCTRNFIIETEKNRVNIFGRKITQSSKFYHQMTHLILRIQNPKRRPQSNRIQRDDFKVTTFGSKSGIPVTRSKNHVLPSSHRNIGKFSPEKNRTF